MEPPKLTFMLVMLLLITLWPQTCYVAQAINPPISKKGQEIQTGEGMDAQKSET